MGSAMLCRRQVWLAQTSLPEPIKQELLNLPVAPGHVFHPGSQEVLDPAERTAASREAVRRLCRNPAPRASGASVGGFRPRLPTRPATGSYIPQASGDRQFRVPDQGSAPNSRSRGRGVRQLGTGRGAGRGGGPAYQSRGARRLSFPAVTDLLGGDCARPLGRGHGGSWLPTAI